MGGTAASAARDTARSRSNSPIHRNQRTAIVNKDPFNNDFFKQHSRMMTRTTSTFLGIWLVWALVCLAGAAGLVYVAIHFISKFW